jgi:hypothetical protein
MTLWGTLSWDGAEEKATKTRLALAAGMQVKWRQPPMKPDTTALLRGESVSVAVTLGSSGAERPGIQIVNRCSGDAHLEVGGSRVLDFGAHAPGVTFAPQYRCKRY